jgi:hypothetical protein
LLQTTIQNTYTHFQKALVATGAKDAHDKLREFEIAMGEFQGKAMAIMRPDAEMASNDGLYSLESDIEQEGEPKAKTPRRTEPDIITSSAGIPPAESEEAEWTKVLGPQARRAQREHRLAHKSMQEIARRIQTPSATMQPKGEGRAKGGGKGKGPGKGPLFVFKVPPAEGPAPKAARPSRWDVGPPLPPGTSSPPAGGPQSTPIPSATEGTSSSSAPTAESAQKETSGVTVQLSDGEWKEVLANRGGDGHLS